MKRTQSAPVLCKDGIVRKIPRPRTLDESIAIFWTRVDRKGPDECWPWIGRIKSEEWPYGIFWNGTNEIKAHRFSYLITNGEIKRGHTVMHKCDNPICVNPAHLTSGTQAKNLEDARNKNRHAFGAKASGLLTDEKVANIRTRYIPRKVSFRALAEEYGVSESCIQAIIERRSWKHIP